MVKYGEGHVFQAKTDSSYRVRIYGNITQSHEKDTPKMTKPKKKRKATKQRKTQGVPTVKAIRNRPTSPKKRIFYSGNSDKTPKGMPSDSVGYNVKNLEEAGRWDIVDQGWKGEGKQTTCNDYNNGLGQRS